MEEQRRQELISLITNGDEGQYVDALRQLCSCSLDDVHNVACHACLKVSANRWPVLYSMMNGEATSELVEQLRQAMQESDQYVRIEAALAAARMLASSTAAVRLELLALLSRVPPADVVCLLETGLSRLTPLVYTQLWDVIFLSSPVLAVRCLADAMDTHRDTASAACTLYRMTALELMVSTVADPGMAAISPVMGRVARRLRESGELDTSVDGGVWERAVEALVEAYGANSGVQERETVVSGLEAMGQDVLELLVSQLEQANPERALLLSRLLKDMRWQPQPDLAGVRYWISMGTFGDCVRAGTLAIEPLCQVFMRGDLEQRDDAARALDRLGWAPADEEDVMPFLSALGRWDQLPLVSSRADDVFECMMEDERQAALERGAAFREPVRRAMITVSESVLDSSGRKSMLRDILLADPAPQVRTDAFEALAENALPAELVSQSLLHELWLVRHSGNALPDIGLRTRLVETLLGHLESQQDAPSLEALLQIALEDPAPSIRSTVLSSLLAMYGASPDVFWPAVERVLVRKQWQSVGGLFAAMDEDALAWLLKEFNRGASGVNQAVLGLAAGILAGCDWRSAVDALWLQDDPVRWEAAVRVYDLLQAYPADGEMLAAYWITRGDMEECRRIGSAAIPALERMLKVGDTVSRAEKAAVLVELGAKPDRQHVKQLEQELQVLATQSDEPIEQMESGKSVVLSVSRESERSVARRLLDRLDMES